MTWQIALAILVLVNTCSVILTKVAADKLPKERAKGIFWQYLFCGVLATGYVLVSGKMTWTPVLFLVGGVGLVNAFGNYCQWQASGLSLSKTTLFFPLMEVVTIALAMVFLQETALWNIQLITGAGLCFLAMGLFRLSKDNARGSLGSRWFLFILGMILIFGVAGFLVKVFAFNLPRENFLMAWYIGAWIGSWPIAGMKKQNPFRISGKTLLVVFPVSLAILGALLTLYWTYQLGGPVSLVLPIRGLAITIIPILVGWWLFKEKKGLGKLEWAGFLTGIIGAIIVLLR